MHTETPGIRPLGFTDTLAQSWSLFQKHFYTFLYIVLIVHLPLNFISQFLVAQLDLSGVKSMQEIINLVSASSGMMVLIAASVVFVPLGTLSIIHVVGSEIKSESISYQQAFQRAIPQWGSLIITGIIAGILVFIGFLFLFVPGMILAIFFMFINQSVALRDKTMFQALAYSMQIVRSDGTRIFLVMIGIGISIFCGYFLVGQVFAILPEMTLIEVLAATTNDFVTSFGTVAATLLFLNAESLIQEESGLKTDPLSSVISPLVADSGRTGANESSEASDSTEPVINLEDSDIQEEPKDK